jgi:hypothetical protein
MLMVEGASEYSSRTGPTVTAMLAVCCAESVMTIVVVPEASPLMLKLVPLIKPCAMLALLLDIR